MIRRGSDGMDHALTHPKLKEYTPFGSILLLWHSGWLRGKKYVT